MLWLVSRRRNSSDEKSPQVSQEFGMVVRRLRGDTMSQEKLAEFAECHPTGIGAIERGETSPNLVIIECIATLISKDGEGPNRTPQLSLPAS